LDARGALARQHGSVQNPPGIDSQFHLIDESGFGNSQVIFESIISTYGARPRQ